MVLSSHSDELWELIMDFNPIHVKIKCYMNKNAPL